MAAAEFYGYNTNKQRRRSQPSIAIPQSRYSTYKPQHSTESPLDTPTHDPYSPPLYPPSHQISNETGSLRTQYDHNIYGDSRHYSDDIPLRSYDQELSESAVYNKHKRMRQSMIPEAPQQQQPQSQPYPVPEPAMAPEGLTGRKRRREPPRKKGFFEGKVPWVVYSLTLIQIVVFIAELVKNGILTSTPIQIHPQVNPMLGPSIYVTINMGSRYVPCMKNISGIPRNATWPCPWSTTSNATDPMNNCTLDQLCGFGDLGNTPNQWYRFITPIFLHVGIIHIAFNLLLQLTLGKEMERTIGSIRFVIVYLSSGIFGFVLGGNFAAQGIASMGASGSLFGIIAIMLLDLLYNWKDRRNPGKELAFIILDIVISLALGLLPGLDNFSHIGGFLMGLVLGICILHSPSGIRERVGDHELPYSPMATKSKSEQHTTRGYRVFARNPLRFFQGRKLLWWPWWLIRAGALIGVIVCFVVLLNNFYVYENTCSWCKYLSCLPVSNWCDVGNITVQNYTIHKRDVFSYTTSLEQYL